MVPPATFTSYYGRPVVKPSPWEADIPVYLFFGGLAAGSGAMQRSAGISAVLTAIIQGVTILTLLALEAPRIPGVWRRVVRSRSAP